MFDHLFLNNYFITTIVFTLLSILKFLLLFFLYSEVAIKLYLSESTKKERDSIIKVLSKMCKIIFYERC